MKVSTVLLLIASIPSIANAARGIRGNRRRLGKKSSSSSSKKSKSADLPMVSTTTSTYEVKLTPENEVAPFIGVDHAFGTVMVEIAKMEYEGDSSMMTKYMACIETDVEGFVPAAQHIHAAPINENGDVVVDFTPLLSMGEADSDGCAEIEMDLYKNITTRPDLYYFNAHAGTAPPLILSAIRGQLVQGFKAKLENDQTVAPFNVNIDGASGMASVAFEAAGTVACFDVAIMNFAPMLGHIHMSAAGTNGGRVFNYSALRVVTEDDMTNNGRFFGCLPLSELEADGVDISVVLDILANPSMYYFDYHLTSEQPEIFTSIRGQLPMMKPPMTMMVDDGH